MNEKNQTNQEQIETQKLGKLYTTQLAEKMFEAHKKFKEENFHLDNSFLYQVAIHASKITLQTNLCRLLVILKKEHQEEEYEDFMKDFKEEVFCGLKEAQREFSKLMKILDSSKDVEKEMKS